MRNASLTILKYCGGQPDVISAENETHIKDVADLCCVRKLLDKNPDLARKFVRMANVSRGWLEIVNFWDDLCFVHDMDGRKEKSKHAQSMLDSLHTQVHL